MKKTGSDAAALASGRRAVAAGATRTTDRGAVDGVRAVDRALDILQAFRAEDADLTVAQLLERVDLSRPTMYRLLATLQQRQFLEGQGEPLRLRLGPATGRLAQAWRSTRNLPQVAEPMMRRVWELSRETVALFVREGLHRVCLAEMPSPQPLSFRRGVGYRERLVLGASGRAILAHMQPDESLWAELRAGLEIDAGAQMKELTRVRQRGYATSRDELITGAVAIAAPVFDAHDAVFGSLAVFGPSVRMPTARVESIANVLREEARALSAACVVS
jgi:IclR family transcriptional regulator, acetate operon repressor